MAAKLPPGPRNPPPLQAINFMRRPAALLETSRERYGDVWTLRLPGKVNNVIVADPELAKDVFTADPALLAGASPPIAKPLFGEHSVLMIDGPQHTAQRKLLEPPLHAERVQRYRGLMAQICEQELASWPLHEPLPLLPRMRTIALKTIMSAIFGVTGGEAQEVISARIRAAVEYSSSLPRLGRMWLSQLRGAKLPRSFARIRDSLDAVIFEEIGRARQDPRLEKRDDILASLLGARHDDGSPMTDRELRDELVTLLIQGHTSTASALAWALERLVRHPEALERLRVEAQTASEDYVDAVVKETLRVRPPLPLPTRRVIQPFMLGEYELEPGTVVMVNTFMLHRRADLYPEPDRFRPERFLEQPAGRYTWIPFGGGPRGCPAASFALCELKVVLRTLALQTRLAPTEQRDEEIRRRAVGFDPSRGARVVLQERVPADGGASVAAEGAPAQRQASPRA
jgi:cytochrome P450